MPTEFKVTPEDEEAERALLAIFDAFNLPPAQRMEGLLRWRAREGFPSGSIALAEWEEERAQAAVTACPRCASDRYSRPGYFRRKTGERLYAVKGKPKVFKACLASRILNLRPPKR